MIPSSKLTVFFWGAIFARFSAKDSCKRHTNSLCRLYFHHKLKLGWERQRNRHYLGRNVGAFSETHLALAEPRCERTKARMMRVHVLWRRSRGTLSWCAVGFIQVAVCSLKITTAALVGHMYKFDDVIFQRGESQATDIKNNNIISKIIFLEFQLPRRETG